MPRLRPDYPEQTLLLCKHNLATHQLLLVGTTAGSTLCSEEVLLGRCREEDRLQLVLAGAALLGHCFPCSLSSVSHHMVVFLEVHSPLMPGPTRAERRCP